MNSNTSEMIDNYDKLQAAGKAADNYPSNLLRSRSFGHTLESYQKRLHDEHTRIFNPDPEYTVVGFLEAFDGQDGELPVSVPCDGVAMRLENVLTCHVAFHETDCTSLVGLKNHLQVNRKDPPCRYV
jgi:hypothetical protein